MYTEPSNFLSQNAHFCKSALARYTQWDFIGMVAKHGVPYNEKKLCQLFFPPEMPEWLRCCKVSGFLSPVTWRGRWAGF